MVDLSQTIQAKSDQLNADDLLGNPITVQITKVSAATTEQPIAINYAGDNGKPYFPCKSMRRVLVNCWSKDGLSYIGKYLTLYRDPEVIFGGIKVGGIRISHMSDIKDEITMSLTASKKSRKPFTVKPLKGHTPVESAKVEQVDVEQLLTEGKIAANLGSGELAKWWKSIGASKQKLMVAELPGLKERAAGVDALSSGENEELPI